MHLGVPFFAVPLQQQFEQELNARYLDWLGYGSWAATPEPDRLRDFLVGAEGCAHALSRYPRQDNECTLACVDELVERAGQGLGKPDRLRAAAMGSWEDR